MLAKLSLIKILALAGGALLGSAIVGMGILREVMNDYD